MVHIHSYLQTQIANRDYEDITCVADACPAVHHMRVCQAAHHWFYAKIVTTQ